MLLKRTVFVLVCIYILLTVTGCWDSLDANNKTLVITVITDKQGDDYAFYIEMPNLGVGQNQQTGNGDSKQKYYMVYANGSSFADARRHIDAKLDNPIFLGTVRALVITDDLAKYGIEEYMLRLQSDNQYRKALNIVTSYSDPQEILSVMPPNNISIGESIADTLVSLKSLGKIVIYTLSDILEFVYSDTCYALVNLDVEDGKFAYNGYTIFHNNQLIDFIPFEEANGLVWILGDNIKRIYTIPFKDFTATLNVQAKSKSITPTYEDGKLVFDIKYEMEAKLMYLSQVIQFDEGMQNAAKAELQNKIANEIAKTIEHSKEINCDYLQFKDCYRIKYPDKLKTINWHDTYENAEFRISVKTVLKFGSMMDFEASDEQLNK